LQVHELASTRIKEVQDKEVVTFCISMQPWKRIDIVIRWYEQCQWLDSYSTKIKSESHEEIIPALEVIKNRYGDPLAIKRIWEKEWHWLFQKYSRTNRIKFVTITFERYWQRYSLRAI
jgi:hypothetical protein